MSFKSLTAVEENYNRRNRLILGQRLSSTNDKTNVHQPLVYSVLAPDPLMSASLVDVQIILYPGDERIRTQGENNFLNRLQQQNQNGELRDTAHGCVRAQDVDYSLPPDSYLVNINLYQLAVLIRDVLMGPLLNIQGLASTLFSGPEHDISYFANLADEFFTLDSYSKCIMFVLFASMWLPSTVSSSPIRFSVVDVFPEYYISVRRKSVYQKHEIRSISNTSNVNVILEHFIDSSIYSGSISSLPPPPPPAALVAATPLLEGTLSLMLSGGQLINSQVTDQEPEETTIPIQLADSTDFIIKIRTPTQPQYRDCLLAFPAKAPFGFYTLSPDAKLILLLPSLLLRNQHTFGKLGINNRWTYAMADFTPTLHLLDLPDYVKPLSMYP